MKFLSLLIKNLFEFDSLKGITLMTNEDSANNEISWFNIMEILDEISYLQKGELLLTTGYKLDNEELNKDLVYKLSSKGLAGMGIQTGYYLDEIPKYIIDAGNKYNFPIFKIPKDLSFSIISHVVLKNAYNINIKFKSELQKNRFIFENLSLGKELSLKEKSQISDSLMLNSNSKLCLLILSVTNAYDNLIPESTMLNLTNKLRNYLHSQGILTMVEISNDKILFLVASDNKLETKNLSINITDILKKHCESEHNLILLIGGSSIFTSINTLLPSFKEAYSSLIALEKIKAKTGICFYNYLGLFKSFGLISSDKYTVNFLQQKINVLIDYDKLHKTNYFYTLKCYLNNDCNINVTSEKLYIHRHTLRNRLGKISELCTIDFNDCFLKLSLSLGIYLHDLFS